MQQSQNVDGIGFSLDVQPNIWELSAMNNSNVFSMNGQPNILQGMGNQICYKVFIMIFIFFICYVHFLQVVFILFSRITGLVISHEC